MKVYRLENKDGRGPYTGGHSSLLTDHLDCGSLWPEPTHDGIRKEWYDNWGAKCGFINEAQLYNWFRPQDLKALLRNGYNIVCIDAEVLGIGRNQVIFKDWR